MERNSDGKSTTFPIAMRFIAGDDTVENVSTAEIPQQQPEEQPAGPAWRKRDFLHHGLFNRKRSGSIETLSSGTKTPPLSSSDPVPSIGTWRLIKGRVTQAMVDIKSSKSDTSSIGAVDLSTEPITSGSGSIVEGSCSDTESNDSVDTSKRLRRRHGKNRKYVDRVEIESGIELTEEMELSQDQQIKVKQKSERKIEVKPKQSNLHRILITSGSLIHFIIRQPSFLIGLSVLIFSWLLALPPYTQGFLTCLILMWLLSTIRSHFIHLLIGDNHPTNWWPGIRKPIELAAIDDLSAIVEHKQHRIYTGWLMECDDYSPETYHQSQTRPIFVKLDGVTLKLSTTTARISKRAMWNEPIVDRKMITFTKQRHFDVTDAQIDMWPKGLARKRHFSRKYPIRLSFQANGGREVFLFARCDREKEDWYRRLLAASQGVIHDQEMVLDGLTIDEGMAKGGHGKGDDFDGLLMRPSVSRNPADYIRFMTLYQTACCSKNPDPIIEKNPPEHQTKRNRREKRLESDFWRGIDQRIYLGPSTSVVWTNVLLGRIIYSCLNDARLLEHINELLQKKLSAIRLPNFMEEVQIVQVNLGERPPLIHQIYQPWLDERGVWIDADCTYEGLMHMTIMTKLNLLRLKRQQNHSGVGSKMDSPRRKLKRNSSSGLLIDKDDGDSETGIGSDSPKKHSIDDGLRKSDSDPVINSAIYDSNAESSGASSSESESFTHIQIDDTVTDQSTTPTISTNLPAGNGSPATSSRKFLRIIDSIATSNIFQSATEIPYIQKAMENMNTKIRLRCELKALAGRIVINIPPPPSDRIWIGFRDPPRLWISATPALGEHTFDWTIVTNAIESKLCDEVNKYLVYPNMIDIIVPFLGKSTYVGD